MHRPLSMKFAEGVMAASGVALIVYLIGVPIGGAWFFGIVAAIGYWYWLFTRSQQREAEEERRLAQRRKEVAASQPPPPSAPPAPSPASTADVTPPGQAESVSARPAKSVADEIAKLAELLKDGLITQEEFEEGKARVLGGAK